MKRILIVDDDDVVRDVLSLALAEFGHMTYKASNGVKALEILRANPEVEIVILDLKMPVMNGHELCPHLKNLNPDIQIIVSSASVDEMAVKELNDLGVRCILRKPYPLKVLQEVINNYSRCYKIRA